MRFGIIVNAGAPAVMADLAHEAEEAGWDGVFYFDGVAIGDAEIFDPWVILAAMAVKTARVRLGAIVTPPSRRRPWKLARETMTLDRLSNGRLVVPVGLGALDDAAFANVGEPTDIASRAELLDESLAILDGLWSGRPFGFEGRHYRFGPMTFKPTPVQQPRIPIWVVGAWPHERSIRRALRWDGVVAQVADAAETRALVEFCVRERPVELATRPFEVVVSGQAGGVGTDPVARYAAAGATWWIEADWLDPSVDSVRRRIATGPPRLD